MRCRYYWCFPVSGQITELNFSGCNVSMTVTWFMNAQSSPAGHTRGAGLIGLESGVLIVTTWFEMRSFPWRRLELVL